MFWILPWSLFAWFFKITSFLCRRVYSIWFWLLINDWKTFILRDLGRLFLDPISRVGDRLLRLSWTNSIFFNQSNFSVILRNMFIFYNPRNFTINQVLRWRFNCFIGWYRHNWHLSLFFNQNLIGRTWFLSRITNRRQFRIEITTWFGRIRRIALIMIQNFLFCTVRTLRFSCGKLLENLDTILKNFFLYLDLELKFWELSFLGRMLFSESFYLLFLVRDLMIVIRFGKVHLFLIEVALTDQLIFLVFEMKFLTNWSHIAEIQTNIHALNLQIYFFFL